MVVVGYRLWVGGSGLSLLPASLRGAQMLCCDPPGCGEEIALLSVAVLGLLSQIWHRDELCVGGAGLELM